MFTIHKSLSFAAVTALLALLLGFTASAQGQGKSEKVPYGLAINFCNWELIETTGNMNIVTNLVEDENGCVTGKIHINSQNVRGVGMNTGDEYRIIDVTTQKVVDFIVCGGCTVEVDIVSTLKVMAKDGTSYISHQVLTLKLDICTWEFSIDPKQISGGCE